MASTKFMSIGGLPFWYVDSASITFQTFAVDSSTDKIFFVFQMPEAATLTGGGYKYESRTGTPPTYRLSLQGVSATTGEPDGTIKGGGSPASVTFTPPADATWDGTWREHTFANSYAATRGELLALVFDYSSGTVDGSNNSTLAHSIPAATIQICARPYGGTINSGAAATKVGDPTFLVRSASKVYGRPILNTNKDSYSSDDTPDEYALRFQLESGLGSTYTVVGVRANFRSGASGKTMLVQLYDGTTALQSITIDSDQLGWTAASGRYIDVYFDESSLSALSFGNAYRVGFAPQEASTLTALYSYQSNAAGDLSAWPQGTGWYLSTRTNSGAWTDVTTKRPLVELIIDDWTVNLGSTVASRARLQGGM